MHFGSKLQLSNKHIYFINDVVNGKTFLVKDLGVYISPDLDWEDQLIKVFSKSTMTAKNTLSMFST